MNLVEADVPFAVLRQEPEQFKGRLMLLGGSVVAVRNTNQGGELEVVQLSTEDSGEIRDNATSGGRFLARSSDFLDPAIFAPGLRVSLVGEVEGKEVRQLAEMEYAYPLLAIREIHLWKPEERGLPPSFHFGIGLGTVIY